jgi:hypothetical protein
MTTFASNVLGHVALLEGLIEAKKQLPSLPVAKPREAYPSFA